MSIHLYAEHLVNIRTLSVQTSLATTTNQETRAILAADGTKLSLSHNGETATIELPVPVPGGQSKATFALPPVPSKQFSFRIQLEEKPGGNFLRGSTDQEPDDIIPWTATSLSASTEIFCRSCNFTIVSRGSINAWKDLPSENWAEMMDFWHCHRPNVSHDHDHNTPTKGYSANSRLVIQPGIGMVDPVDFVLAVEDCQNLKTIPSHPSTANDNNENPISLSCSKCDASIGQIHNTGEGYKLRKLSLSLSLSSSSPSKSYEQEKWLACHLLSSIETQGVRKFLIRPSPDSDDGISSMRIWIFNPDINIASSASSQTKPMRAVKIFWKDAEPLESSAVDGREMNDNEGRLDRQTLSEGEIELPIEEFRVLREAFTKSANLLPEGSKTFQEQWRVALLSRFIQGDVEPREAVEMTLRRTLSQDTKGSDQDGDRCEQDEGTAAQLRTAEV